MFVVKTRADDFRWDTPYGLAYLLTYVVAIPGSWRSIAVNNISARYFKLLSKPIFNHHQRNYPVAARTIQNEKETLSARAPTLVRICTWVTTKEKQETRLKISKVKEN